MGVGPSFHLTAPLSTPPSTSGATTSISRDAPARSRPSHRPQRSTSGKPRAPRAVVGLGGDLFERQTHEGREPWGDGLGPHLDRVLAFEERQVRFDEPVMEADGGVGDGVRHRVVRSSVDVGARGEVAEVDQAGELVAQAGVVGEARALRDLVAPGLTGRDGAQDGAVLGYVAQPLLLVERRLDELPHFAAR